MQIFLGIPFTMYQIAVRGYPYAVFLLILFSASGSVLGLDPDCLTKDLPAGRLEWQDQLAQSTVSVEWGFGNVSTVNLDQ